MARLWTSHFLSVLRSSESNVGYQPKKWPRLRYAIVAVLAAATALVALRVISPLPPIVVPVPGDLERLEPQLRAYLKDKIEWTRKAPRDVHRQATLGMVYAANALWSESRMAFQNAAQIDPKEPLARLYVAISTQELGDFDEALNRFRQITSEFPDFPQGYYRLGDALLRAGKVEEAETGFQRLITLAPKEWRGYAGLGEVKLRKGAFEDAISLLEKAISLDPD